ncbi:MAG: FAD-dependent oxidoreductase, partial [Verrucomicrobia bacterium]|nr:FAD-dependent oxidoreductase [Verrucomicrobiota bacterium]
MHTALSKREGLADTPKDLDWLARNIPCQAACPAHTDIPGYLEAISRGDFEEAYRINLADNVFPAVLGRVCSRPCEKPCRHGWEGLGESVAICFSKRSAADFLKQTGPVVLPTLFPPTGRKIAVVGAGVAGLAAARELVLWGHRVTVYERHARPGGLLRLGIPPFRLPREIVDREIRQVEAQGVGIRCGVEIGPGFPLERLAAEHDAVIVAAGAFRPTMPRIPGTDLEGVEAGLPFLTAVNEHGRTASGRRVVVIGGGFTAMDCARVALRL